MATGISNNPVTLSLKVVELGSEELLEPALGALQGTHRCYAG
jgi:hypothetical protein